MTSVLSAAVAVPTGFLAARWVGATAYGNAQFVILAYFFASLARVGVFEGGVREYIHFRALGRADEAAAARDTGATAELIVAVLPGLLLVAAAPLLDQPLRRLGLALGPLAAVASSLNAFCGGIALAEQRFGLVARVTLLRSVLVSGIILGLTPRFGPAVIFIAPLVGDLASTGVYVGRPPRPFALRFDGPLAKRLLSDGFPLGAGAIVYWVYRQVGSASVAAMRPSRELGLYAFAAGPVLIVTRAIAQLEAVIQPRLWGSLATSAETWRRDAAALVTGSAIVAAAATNSTQALFGPMVAVVAPRFSGSIRVLDILALNIFVLSIGAVPTLVVDSKTVNRQRQSLSVWLVALAVNIGANVVVLRGGRGVYEVALNDVWIQACVVVAVFLLAARHAGRFRGSLYAMVVATFTVCVTMSVWLARWSIPQGPTTTAVATGLAREASVVAVWMLWAVLARWTVSRARG